MAIANIKDSKIEVEHDGKLWISTASHLESQSWKNKELSWSRILAKLSKCERTGETFKEYLSMTKPQQTKAKDKGGFVGGRLSGGRRIRENVASRSLITIDVDHATGDFLAFCDLELPYAWAVYSTHSHSPEKPRYRLLIPLEKEVRPDEYEAIIRKIADEIGMDRVDHTCFQVQQLMFWPSAASDAEYVFEYNDADFLKPEDVLKEYPDWKDRSYWPTHPEESKRERREVEKQQDPLTKENTVGDFCRSFTIQEAIDKFLPDVYERGVSNDRYTYKEGTSANGVVIYDDRFAYSHHATDPASLQCLNAFDLVRVHKFRELDEEAKPGTRADRMPSYIAMCDMASELPEVKREALDRKKLSALEDFADELEGSEDEDWRLKLKLKKNTGEVLSNLQNLQLIMLKDEKLKGLALNELDELKHKVEPMPWSSKVGGTWGDSDDDELYAYLSNFYADFKISDVRIATTVAANRRTYHPIKERLESATWDGVNRAETLFIDYLGAEDCEYVREVTKLFLTACVARIYEPGCKFDNTIVLSGPGGIGKSTLLDKIGMEWFSDNLTFEDMKNKEGQEKIRSTWINEVAELKGMRKTDVESIKSFISRREDKYRPSYGRHPITVPRHSTFIGTSNSEAYLKDLTGNRRFWPVSCEGKSTKKAWRLKLDDVLQIWAEVKEVFYESIYGTDLVLSKALEKEAEKRQRQALEGAEQEGLIELYLNRLLPEEWSTMDLEDRLNWLDTSKKGSVKRTRVCVAEIWHECFRQGEIRRKRTDSDDIVRSLLRLGWGPIGERRTLYGNQRCFEKVTIS